MEYSSTLFILYRSVFANEFLCENKVEEERDARDELCKVMKCAGNWRLGFNFIMRIANLVLISTESENLNKRLTVTGFCVKLSV